MSKSRKIYKIKRMDKVCKTRRDNNISKNSEKKTSAYIDSNPDNNNKPVKDNKIDKNDKMDNPEKDDKEVSILSLLYNNIMSYIGY